MPDTPQDSGDMRGEYNHKILDLEVNLRNHLMYHILHTVYCLSNII